MNAEAKQRAIGTGAAKARAGGTERGSMRLRRSGVTLASAARSGLQQMRAAAARAALGSAVAPVTMRRVTRPHRPGAISTLDQHAARLWRASATERVSSLSSGSTAAMAMLGVTPSCDIVVAEQRAGRRVRTASVRSAILYKSGAASVSLQPVGMAELTRRSARPAARPLHLGEPAWGRARKHRAGSPITGPMRRLRVVAGPAGGVRAVAAGPTIVRTASAAPGEAAVGAAAKRAPVAPVDARLVTPSQQQADVTNAPGSGSPIPGMHIGRWVTDYLTDAAMRPPSGLSGLDDRLTPVFAGMVGFG